MPNVRRASAAPLLLLLALAPFHAAGAQTLLPVEPSAVERSIPSAEPAPPPALLPEPAPRPARFTRGQAITLGLVSSVFGLGSVAVDYIPAPGVAGLAPNSYYHYGTSVLAAAPIAVVSPADAFAVGDWTLALGAGDLALRYQGARNDISPYHSYWSAVDTFTVHHGIYAPYVAYRDARVAGSSDVWNDAWRPYSAEELVVAPLQWRNINHPVVWAGVSIDAGLTGIVVGAQLATKTAFIGTPRAVGRSIGLGTLTSWDAGVTEDALFRGFFYEELQLSLGRWPARAIDMTVFTLSHVPGEIGESSTTILAGIADRAFAGLLFEMAYDQGGLPESVTAHVLWDTVDNLVTSLVAQTLTPTYARRSTLLPSYPPPPTSATLVPGGPAVQPIHQVFSMSFPWN